MNDVVSILKLAVYGFCAWIGINVEAFTILIVFMCLDSIFGAIKSVRMGNPFSFYKLLWGFLLKLCILIIPLVIALLGKALGHDFSIAMNIVISILNVSEVYSIFGNILSAKNKIEVKKIDAVSMVLKSIRIALKTIIIKLVKHLEKVGDCEIKH